MTLAPSSADRKIAKLVAELKLPSELRFGNVELAFEARSAGAQIATEQLEDGRRRIQISVIEGGQPLPAVDIARVTIDIAHDVKEGALKILVLSVEAVDSSGAQTDLSHPAEIPVEVVSSKLLPLVSCFFYMH